MIWIAGGVAVTIEYKPLPLYRPFVAWLLAVASFPAFFPAKKKKIKETKKKKIDFKELGDTGLANTDRHFTFCIGRSHELRFVSRK